MSKLSLDDYRVQYKLPVQWGEMDAARHVNNLVYLRWSESARIHYFEQMKMDTSFANEAGPILAWQDCKYIFPMTFPDNAIIGVRTIEVLADRFQMQCAIFSERHNRLAALSHQTIMAYDYIKLRKVALPKSWTKAITRL